MPEFTIRSENVDVEQIMRQIRLRIKEKRGVDYTEDEVRELASVKLEKFLNPSAVRSELVEHYRRQRPPVPLPPVPPAPENYGFEAHTIYESHRGPLQWVRKLLNPLLKLFFNPNPLIQVLHRQGKINAYLLQEHQRQFDQISQRFVARDELDGLNFEMLNNLVLELTRVGIEVKNLKMRIEAMAARQEFNERRARAFEGAVQYKPAVEPGEAKVADEGAAAKGDEGDARTRRRRRRRGRRRPGPDASAAEGAASATSESGPREPAPRDDEGFEEDAPGPSSEPDTDR